jgi:hypothetical protein
MKISRCCHEVRSVTTYLLIPNSKLALGLLVLVCKSLELLDGFGLQDFDAELNVAFGVLMSGLNT